MAEETLSSQQVFQGRLIRVRVDRVRLPNGGESSREIVEHHGAVAIVALDGEGNVLLVRQFRKAVERTLLEIPAGTLEPGEDPLECAHRELKEETGCVAGRMEHLGGFYSAPGFCTEYLTLYLATDLTPGPSHAEFDEDIELVRLPLAQAPRLIASGAICDSKSIIGLLSVRCLQGL
jgi:ADP-ribose pyrophosphatase